MPEGIIGTDRYGLPSQTYGTDANMGVVNVTVVLYVGSTGDVSSYRGEGTPEWVAAHGDRIPLEDAERHFPSLRSELAARGHTFCGRRFEAPRAGDEADGLMDQEDYLNDEG